jgi:hypothetical protein
MMVQDGRALGPLVLLPALKLRRRPAGIIDDSLVSEWDVFEIGQRARCIVAGRRRGFRLRRFFGIARRVVVVSRVSPRRCQGCRFCQKLAKSAASIEAVPTRTSRLANRSDNLIGRLPKALSVGVVLFDRAHAPVGGEERQPDWRPVSFGGQLTGSRVETARYSKRAQTETLRAHFELDPIRGTAGGWI